MGYNYPNLFFSKMTDIEKKEKLLNLYKKALEKWDNIIEDIPESLNRWGDKCAFCRECEDNHCSFVSVTGSGCANYCLIDREICGSEDSLLSILEDEYYHAKSMYPSEVSDFKGCWALVEEIKESLRQKIEELQIS